MYIAINSNQQFLCLASTTGQRSFANSEEVLFFGENESDGKN